jgi:GH15 family glucan-1,4-alpha-glucosidase
MAKALDRSRTGQGAVFSRTFFPHNAGLLSEDVDVDTGELLGNFPQAYSHMAVINTAHQLSRA